MKPLTLLLLLPCSSLLAQPDQEKLKQAKVKSQAQSVATWLKDHDSTKYWKQDNWFWTYTPNGDVQKSGWGKDTMTENIYDSKDILIKKISYFLHSVSSTTTYEYDAAGRETKQTTPHPESYRDTTYWINSYDPKGNRASRTFRNKNEIYSIFVYTYDSLGRKIIYSAFDKGSSTPDDIWYYIYDNAGNVTQFSRANAEGYVYQSEHNKYDTHNLLIEKTEWYGTLPFNRFEYTYDIAGNKTEEKYFHLETLIYVSTCSYNEKGLLISEEKNFPNGELEGSRICIQDEKGRKGQELYFVKSDPERTIYYAGSKLFFYNANDQVESTVSYSQSNKPENKEIYTYNKKGQLSGYIYAPMKDIAHYHHKYEFVYNKKGEQTKEIQYKNRRKTGCTTSEWCKHEQKETVTDTAQFDYNPHVFTYERTFPSTYKEGAEIKFDYRDNLGVIKLVEERRYTYHE